ncbi:phage/plasmid primase, P4 family [soil metagenome]
MVSGSLPVKRKPILNPEAFHGRVDHKDVLQKLLSEITPVNFRDIISLPDEEDIKQRHLVVAVVQHFMQVAKERNWNLCKRYDFTYIYNGAYWKQCSKEDIKYFLRDAAIKMGLPEYDAKHYEFIEKLFKQFLSDAHLPAPEIDEKRILINLQNGTFEFTDQCWKLRDFIMDDFLTYQLPFAFAENAKCPIFDSYLMKVLPDESSRAIMQEYAGFIFTDMNLEKCLVLTGTGSNGKSVYFNIINALIGKDNILNYSLGLFNHEYNRAKLVNVLLNYSSEKGFDLNPETFKVLISGEPIQAREIYGKPFTLRNRVRFILNCNELPRETESTEAYFRRFIIIPFDVKITDAERDIDLAQKIIASELPGVFNWLLVGLNRIMQQGAFTWSEKADKALGDFRKQSDSVQLYVEEFRFCPSLSNKEALTELYTKYKDFCKDDGYKPVGKVKFSTRLLNKGFEKTRLNDGGIAYFMEKGDNPF